jgi:voltage-gated potassium channel
VVAHEVYAQLSTPLLWRFIQEMPAKGDDWAADAVTLLEQKCGRELQSLWRLKLTHSEAPALAGWLASGEAKVTDLLRNPDDRDQQLPAVCLLVVRDDEALLLPDEHFVARHGDELLFAGDASALRSLSTTALLDATAEYVLYDRHIPSSWVWRRFTRKRALAAAGR